MEKGNDAGIISFSELSAWATGTVRNGGTPVSSRLEVMGYDLGVPEVRLGKIQKAVMTA